MKKVNNCIDYLLLFLLIFLSYYNVSAQKNIKDYIITTPIYSESFESINSLAEAKISLYLKGRNLSELVDTEIISRKDMRDFALPLGVHDNYDPISFEQGMSAMWEYKCRKYIKNADVKSDIDTISAKAINLISDYPKKMDLNVYRDNVLKPVIDSIYIYHQQIQQLYRLERQVFMDLIVEQLSPNMLLGYNIHELLPPRHFTQTKEELMVNPIFKIYYFDRLLQEAGCEFICYFPARNDELLSFGPFQFTNIALADIQANNRLTNNFKIFKTMKDLKSIEDHSLLAIIFAYNNWERLSMSLYNQGLINKFNEKFKDADAETKRNLRIFIAGVTACMHHNPPKTWRLLTNYLKNHDDLSNLYFDWIKKEDDLQLFKVYHSSSEIYLFSKVY